MTLEPIGSVARECVSLVEVVCVAVQHLSTEGRRALGVRVNSVVCHGVAAVATAWQCVQGGCNWSYLRL
jgi:hypothetical protein